MIRKIEVISEAADLDPDLVLAIATVESGLNPKAVGLLGEQGVFQLRPEYHRVIKGNTGHNTLVAVAYLSELRHRFQKKYGDAWFVLYNTGPGRAPKYPDKSEYYRKVMNELGKLKFKRMVAVQ